MRCFLIMLISLCLLQSVYGGKPKIPKITGQKELTTSQGNGITIQLSDLYVEQKDDGKDDKGEGNDDDDDDNSDNEVPRYPTGYTLEIFNGQNYQVSGNTVTPDPGFSGILTVEVRVRNDQHASKKFDLKITVTSANKPPVITGQLPLSITVNTSLQIKLSHLTVTDPDNAYPSDFTLKILPGDQYSVNKNVVTPAQDFTGSLVIRVVVNDGQNDSDPFDAVVNVSPEVNISPVISGQIPVSISKNQALTILLSHLLVTDPDNVFPSDFALKVYPGENFDVKESVVTPHKDFTGELAVPVSVSDGTSESKVYHLKINVTTDSNIKPIILGQSGLKTIEGKNLEVKLSHLVVTDPDNQYPQDFTLQVSEGNHYTVTNYIIAPASGYVGMLQVRVSVNDGNSVSDPYHLIIEVIPQGSMEILSQQSLEMFEDSSMVIRLSDLMVSDPTDAYPEGYDLQILQGDHYRVSKNTIKPDADFHGNLNVPLRISNGSESASFTLLVDVKPVNDPPVLLQLPVDPLIARGSGPWILGSGVEVRDVDDEQILYAEIGFQLANYNPLTDGLSFEETENIHGVFDAGTGVLFLLGNAMLQEYERILRSVNFTYLNEVDSLQETSKIINIRLNDGKDFSGTYERIVLLSRDVALDIPSAFTPNNDRANDTWKITAYQDAEKLNTVIRVYSQKGILVFETNKLENEWDGEYNGAPLPSDVYYYTIEMDLAFTKKSYKGIVTILR